MFRAVLILSFLLGISAASAHVVNQLYSEWTDLEQGWQLEVQFDAGYADPATRDDPFQPPLTRGELLALSEAEWAALRREAEQYLREMIVLEVNGRLLGWELSFPDWDQSPPDFPVLLNGIGYFRAHISGQDSGRVAVGVAEGTFPKLIVENEGQFLVLDVGEKRDLREGGRWWVWLREGYRHVIPLGWDHVLFVCGLFFYRRKIGDLVHQSLAFTAAHSLTLGLASAGWVVVSERWQAPLEIAIALSLVVVGVENLRAERTLKLRLALVFLLGLLHGLGFAGALASYVDRSQLIASVAALNLGVELAQISLLALAWLCTVKWHLRPDYERVRIGGSLAVALAGGFWATTRLLEAL